MILTDSDIQFLERFDELQGNPDARPARVSKAPPTRNFAHLNVDDTDSEDDLNSYEVAVNPHITSMDEWKTYLNTIEDILDGVNMVRWWGVCLSSFHFHVLLILRVCLLQMNGSRYPTWRSMAGDYLAVMASSVASERAFSSAGITISKRRNRLDGDIVEALQCLKSLTCQDLMLRVSPTIADEEMLLDDADRQRANREGLTTDVVNDAEEWMLEALAENDDGDNANDVDNVTVG